MANTDHRLSKNMAFLKFFNYCRIKKETIYNEKTMMSEYNDISRCYELSNNNIYVFTEFACY